MQSYAEFLSEWSTLLENSPVPTYIERYLSKEETEEEEIEKQIDVLLGFSSAALCHFFDHEDGLLRLKPQFKPNFIWYLALMNRVGDINSPWFLFFVNDVFVPPMPRHELVEISARYKSNKATLDDLEQKASAIGWPLKYTNPLQFSEEDIERERSHVFQQILLWVKLDALFDDGLPQWVLKELQFPISESWPDVIDSRIDFDAQWRLAWARECLRIHPIFHHRLPVLPDNIQSQDVSPMILQQKNALKFYLNKVLMFWIWLSPTYWKNQLAYNKAAKELSQRQQTRRERVQHRYQAELEKQRTENSIYRWAKIKHKMDSFKLKAIPAGGFFMGAHSSEEEAGDNEKPRHFVTLTRGFSIGVFPVTQELYHAVMNSSPSRFLGSKRPVEGVSWCDAVVFCNRLSVLEGVEPVYILPEPHRNDIAWMKSVRWKKHANGYRLPTEAEWEYAAGDDGFLYSGSDNIDDVAWYKAKSKGATHVVGLKDPNTLGLYDMTGNVMEWVWDAYVKNAYHRSDATDPVEESPSQFRVRRGGSWSSQPKHSRITSRRGSKATYRSSGQGFRIVKNDTMVSE